MTETHSGGCQCGAIRFKITGPIDHLSICNCRMCQKATRGLFGAFATPNGDQLVWTRGKLSHFQSSKKVKRGFCSACGTPLTYDWGGEGAAITIGAFDNPNVLVPTKEYAPTSRHPLLAHLNNLHGENLGSDKPEDQDPDYVSFQHPDHDTANWPPTE